MLRIRRDLYKGGLALFYNRRRSSEAGEESAGRWQVVSCLVVGKGAI